MQDLKLTPKGNSYYEGNGAYSKEYEELCKKLVPDNGECETLHGELIRAATRLTHEYYNNGNCNAVDPIVDYGDYEDYNEDDVEIEGYEVREFYNNFITLIYLNIPGARECIQTIEQFIIEIGDGHSESGDHTYSEEEEQPYVEMMDRVIHFVLTTEDKPLPDWYTKEEKEDAVV